MEAILGAVVAVLGVVWVTLGAEWVVLAVAAAAGIVVGVLHVRHRRLSAALRGIPGPFAFPIIGSAHRVITMKKHGFFKLVDDAVKEYGKFFVTWNGAHLPEVHLSDARDIEVLMRSSVNITKGYGYTFLHPWLGLGLLTSTGTKWHSRRKLITPTFHFKILESFQEVVAEKAEVMIRRLEQHAVAEAKDEAGAGVDEGFDVYPFITECALDIICVTAMGTEINAQEGANAEYVSAIYDISELIVERMTKVWLHPDLIYFMTKDGARYRQCLETLHAFTNKVIQERKKTLEDGPKLENIEDEMFGRRGRRLAFLDLLLRAAADDPSLTDDDIRMEVDTFMFEGHDTTSASLCWSIFLLGNHLDIQERAWEEQQAIFGDSDRPPTMQDLSEMKYLEMVIKESLRLYPSVPVVGRTIIEDIQIGEHRIPEGVQATIHIYHAHRDPKHFPDPDVFNPDNFLPDRTQGRHPYAYIPFSAGPRNCIGQKFALLEEKTMLSAVLRRFQIRSLQKPSDITLVGELILRPLGGVHVTLQSRRRGVSS